jgi:hypothetical protein
MVNQKTIKKKFDKLFKNRNGLVNYDKETKLVLSPCRCMAMGFFEESNLISENEISEEKRLIKMPIFKSSKTLAVINSNWLKRSIELLEMMGFTDIAVKMSHENEYPVELIGIREDYETGELAFTSGDRIMIAPRISASEKTWNWLKKETRGQLKRKKK